MKKLYLLFLIVLPMVVFSQEEAWVYFNAKANEQYFYDNPLQMLSQRSLDRRLNQQIDLDFKDIPINHDFIAVISSVPGIKVMAKSKWLNAVHVRGSQELLNYLKEFSCVAKVDFANKQLNEAKLSDKIAVSLLQYKKKEKNEKLMRASLIAIKQIEMLNGQILHQQNFRGSGKIIAVLDAGFLGVDKTAAFKRIRDNHQILGGYNFVMRDENIYSLDSHGTSVLSTMAAYVENKLEGTAPEASYYLFITEDVRTENPVEESLWVEAAEKADSLGVDIINTSLGYSDFDNPLYNHSDIEIKETGTFISKAAEIASSRGMIVIASAGNDGDTPDPYVGAPADAPSVVTVGAVRADKTRAVFSSIGPDFDNRIKPDVMAQGENTLVTDEKGNLVYLSGSSFSAPIISGMLACLWQAFPDKTNEEIKELMYQSANRYTKPNNEYGYGIPDFNLALKGGIAAKKESFKYYTAYPNPATDFVKVDFPVSLSSGKVFFYSVSGQNVLEEKIEGLYANFSLASLNKGVYFYQIESNSFLKSGKIIKK